MTESKLTKKILHRLNLLERRVKALEQKKITPQITKSYQSGKKKKALTLPEIIREQVFKNGQEKVAVIVGYYEKVQNELKIKPSHVEQGWKVGKFDGKYNPNLLNRAIRDGLVRNINGSLDLSQSGEKFFRKFLRGVKS